MFPYKHLIKSTIANILYYTGILNLIKRYKLSNKLVVLMYHRVLNQDEINKSCSNAGIIVDTNTFESHMRFLSRHFELRSIDYVIDKIQKESNFKCGDCLITFDDGWLDNYVNAFPIMKKFRTPAIIFLPLDYISSDKVFWQEHLFRLIEGLLKQNVELPSVLEKHLPTEITDHRSAIQECLFELKSFSNEEIDNFTSTIETHYRTKTLPFPDNSVDKYMNWDQIRNMSQTGIQFGSHAISHRLLTKLSPEDLRQELEISKQAISKELNLPVDSIAYPNGNYDENVLTHTESSGYKIAFSTKGKDIYFSSGNNRFSIKRINIHQNTGQTIPLLMCNILRIF